MRANRWLFGSTLLPALLLIAACDGGKTAPPEPTPQPATPGETKSTLTSVGTSASDLARELQAEFDALMKDWGLSGAVAHGVGGWASVAQAVVPDVGLLSSGKLRTTDAQAVGKEILQAVATVEKLPRGVYTCSGSYCTKKAESDDYVASRTTAKGVLKVELDWDASSLGTPSPTVQLHMLTNDGSPYQGYFIEAPTKMVAKVSLDAQVLAQGTLAVAWHPSSCLAGKYLHDVPDSLELSGFVNRPGGGKAIEASARYGIGAGKVHTSGSLSAKGASNEASVQWDVSSVGAVERSGCGRLSNFTPANLDFSAGVSADGQSLALSFLADQFQSGPQASFRLQNGVLKVNKKQVTFSGVLDDANGNCVPGENVTLTFSSGSTSLEAFLIGQLGLRTCR